MKLCAGVQVPQPVCPRTQEVLQCEISYIEQNRTDLSLCFKCLCPPDPRKRPSKQK